VKVLGAGHICQRHVSHLRDMDGTYDLSCSTSGSHPGSGGLYCGSVYTDCDCCWYDCESWYECPCGGGGGKGGPLDGVLGPLPGPAGFGGGGGGVAVL